MSIRAALGARAFARLSNQSRQHVLAAARFARPVSVSVGQRPSSNLTPESQQSYVTHGEELDPHMTGDFVNPIPEKRSLRDPYGDWWDPQERRNFGEPVHEDNDILGVFSTESYTHFTTGWGAVLIGTFCAGMGVLLATVYQLYPDKASAPRTFPDGLERELGGAGALPARTSSDV